MALLFDKNTTGEDIARNLAHHISGKVICTTGVSPGGLGASFVEIIAKQHPKLLILAGRKASKVQQTADAILKNSPGVQIRVLELDLGSQTQVRKAAEEVNSYEEPSIDVLVNNAGIMACPYRTTPEGIESQFGTNHIGHFLFTNLIMGKILASGPSPRVISVASDGYRLSPIRYDWKFDDGKTYNRWLAYGQSKTANMLFAISLAEKLGKKGLVCFSLHPGVVMTGLATNAGLAMEDFGELQALDRAQGHPQGWTEFSWKTLSQGVATHILASFSPDIVGDNGKHCSDTQVLPDEKVRPWARDSVEADNLWKLSEEIVGQKFTY